MGFTEKTQVFLIAAWYKELNEAFGERGQRTFVLAVKHYARQRGERMAQRAVRDGQPLNYASYCAYCEWAPSEGDPGRRRGVRVPPAQHRAGLCL